jgi:predicted dehydrogenase
VGVAGVGRLGREHARILSRLPGAELAGVHDRDTERGRAVAREAGTRHADGLEDLLRDADAVVVAVPTRHHHRVARAALDGGCHVLVEKPVARSLEEADDLISTARERGLTLGVGHVERFNGAVREGIPHLDRPRFLESLRLAPFQPRGTDVTVILDLMIHDIDLVLGLLESPLDSIHAVGTPVLTDQIDIANARLVFRDGSVAEITASRVSEEPTRVLRAFQDTGYLRLDLARGEGEFLRRREGPAGGGSGAPEGAASLEELVERIPLRGDDREPLRLELEAFLDAVAGRPSRIVSADDARRALEIALRITREIEHFNDAALETA